ncbi:MAG: tRNA preQ1(34) S-adenosylmethionine ribosyltransferase-isomerase QueA [Thermomicrobiales bacterium]|nr:tRNA preQ1(34) S-adenosylmethionine ribosyltransferase-isomerase QueA [Thermomicrobiales bacterium]
MRTSDFDYDLPPELIAQTPLEQRDASRLLVLHRATDELVHSTVDQLPSLLQSGDLLVANNSRVLAARLTTRKSDTGGRVELLLLHPRADGSWEALAKPGRRLHPGTRLAVEGSTHTIEMIERLGDGLVALRLEPGLLAELDRFGTVPLPPYIHERLDDPNRYQTVYSAHPGSAAAPTAGLHFTPELIERLRAAGIGWAEVTLDIGLDTFRPVAVDDVSEHKMHSEVCRMDAGAVAAIQRTKQEGGRVIALGTTAARTLETAGQLWRGGDPAPFETPTGIFITPGYEWQLVDGLFTNFHLPKSTLIMMVSALAGRERILAAYRMAIRERYRFFSFGDAMLIL